MGKPVNSNVKRVETFPLNTKVNKEVLDKFRDSCSYRGYPMNVMLETFMRQYTDGKFNIEEDDILKWENDTSEKIDALSTTLNKQIYSNFKFVCKVKGYRIKHIITAFMDKFVNGDFILEYVDVSDIE